MSEAPRSPAAEDLLGGAGAVLLLDKPAGPTSHDLVGWARWALRVKAVGHAGTLDPAATGLMVLCAGPATRLAAYLSGEDKTYRAHIRLGTRTTTGDAEGEVLESAEVSEDALAGAPAALESMRGPLELAPPAYSAIRVDGRRAHEAARAGQPLDVPKRSMVVLGIDEVEVDGARVSATLRVSKGTYVRSLAEELGRRLGLPAHLEGLRRLASGGLELSAGSTVCDLRVETFERAGRTLHRVRPAEGDDREASARVLQGALLAPELALPFRHAHVRGEGDARVMARLLQGQRISPVDPDMESMALRALRGLRVGPVEDGRLTLVDRSAGALVIARREPERWAPERTLRPAPRRGSRSAGETVPGVQPKGDKP